VNETSRIIHDVFYIDGSLRDIYVLGTSEHDWQALLTYLRVSPYPWEYSLDDEVRPLPEHAADILALREQHSPLLQIDQPRLGLNCHFFSPEEIEFDLDPKDFRTKQDVSYLLDFLRTIGRVLNKSIILTGENDARGPLFRYDPATNEDTWFLEEIDR
jgi:hypothetical protein